MRYYFSSTSSVKKTIFDCDIKNVLLSYALDKKDIPSFKDKNYNILIDSGAFTVWNSGKPPINVESYKSFIEKFPKHWNFINLDVIPQTGSSESDIKKCIDEGFENFLNLRGTNRNILPVHHYGENLNILKRYLEYTDYVCISPANDTHENVKREYLKMIFDYIGVGRIKTHGLGYSSAEGLKLFPFYSVDSISYRRFKANNCQFWWTDKMRYFGKSAVRKFIHLEKTVTNIWKERGLEWKD